MLMYPVSCSRKSTSVTNDGTELTDLSTLPDTDRRFM